MYIYFPGFSGAEIKCMLLSFRVTSLEQLGVAEFRDELARPKAYENGLKHVLAIWLDLELKVKNVKNLSF